jgi:hypothetical protein
MFEVCGTRIGLNVILSGFPEFSTYN